VKKATLVLVGIGLGLLCIEVFLRLTGYGLVRPQLHFDTNTRLALQAGQFVPDGRLLWRESPSSLGEGAGPLNLVRANDTIPPKSRKFRILCLGDSCTRLAPRDRPFSVILQERLDPRRVEVFNAGVPGYTSQQGLVWLRTELLAYQPDLVVVYFGWNDHWRTTGWTDRELMARYAWWRPRWLNLLQGHREPPPFRVALEEFAQNLRAIAAEVAQQGGQTLFLTAPGHFTDAARTHHLQTGYILPGDNPAAIHAQYAQEVRRLATELQGRVFDVAQLFTELQQPQYLLFPDGIHPTDLGHLVLAATLADQIAVEFLGAQDLHSEPLAVGLGVIAQSLAASHRWQEALQGYARAVQTAPQDLNLLLGYTWLLATCPADSFRNPTHAVSLLEGYAGPAARGFQYHDVHAAALAGSGRFAEATTAAQAALADLAARGGDDSPLADAIRQRLELYREGKSFQLRPPPTE
jgi:lysophospholipase L1-like esterase